MAVMCTVEVRLLCGGLVQAVVSFPGFSLPGAQYICPELRLRRLDLSPR
ncbi:hypothetical protein ACIPYR_35150 [Streptomyces parvus]